MTQRHAFICDAIRTPFGPLRRCSVERARRRPGRNSAQGADAAQPGSGLTTVTDILLAAPTRLARTTATLRAWPACLPACRWRCPAPPYQPPVRLRPDAVGSAARAIKAGEAAS